jgi:archaellum biogenesis ATPase FlaH
MLNSFPDIARYYVSGGLCPIPIKPDGSKRPDIPTWAEFQHRKPTDEELDRFFAKAGAIAVTCGKASDNLEVLDFDEPGYYERWLDQIPEDLKPQLVVMRTPSGGRHVWYRTHDQPPSNRVLARTSDNKVAIETRGQGGYVVCAPTKGYAIENTANGKIPVITDEQREDLFEAAYHLHEGQRTTHSTESRPRYAKPSEEFASEHSWSDLLEGAGWTECGHQGKYTFWRRPGKRHGKSASTNGEDGVFYCFTSNAAPLEPNHAYTKFAWHAAMNHGGDFMKAVEAYRSARGEGGAQNRTNPNEPESPRTSPSIPQRWARINEYDQREIGWLFYPYIPLEEVTLVAGDPGVGKSTFMQAIASAVSTGGQVMGTPIAKGRVIFLSAEQGVRTVTVPRFKEMGADGSQIMTPDDEHDAGDIRPFVLDQAGVVELANQVATFRPSLVVIDTVTAYIEAARDMNTANQVREWIRRLQDIARKNKTAVVLIAHPNKSSGQKALYRVGGSIDLVGATRSVLFCGEDPDTPGQSAAVHIKTNVGPKGTSIGFTCRDGRFSWTGACTLTADRFDEKPSRGSSSPRSDAVTFLKELLHEGPMSAESVLEEGRKAGISERTLRRAKSELGVLVKKNSFDGGWTWSLTVTDAETPSLDLDAEDLASDPFAEP